MVTTIRMSDRPIIIEVQAPTLTSPKMKLKLWINKCRMRDQEVLVHLKMEKTKSSRELRKMNAKTQRMMSPLMTMVLQLEVTHRGIPLENHETK